MLSRSSEPFRNRVEAGRLLAEELRDLCDRSAVVLGIPRGGVVVAAQLAEGLGCELDIVLSRKLRSPRNPELAIGAITEEGKVFLHEGLGPQVAGDEGYLAEEKDRRMAEIERRRSLYRSVRPRVPLKGRRVVLTDDGVATGATMNAAVWAARREGAERLVVALPVAPESSVRALAEEADEVVCLRAPALFQAIGQFYVDFAQVADAEVVDLLRAAGQEAAGGNGC
jgi:predicted phosphoribosyltransferase